MVAKRVLLIGAGLLAASLCQAQVTQAGKGYLFRVSFIPKQKLTYAITNRVVGSTDRTVPQTVTVNCTEIVKGFYHVEVEREPLPDSVDQPDYRKMWVTERGHSNHPLALWFDNCPYGPIKLKTYWKGYPPPLAGDLGVPKYSPFDYRLMGFRTDRGKKEALIAFSYVRQLGGRTPIYNRFSGSLVLDATNGQIVDLTVSKAEPNPERGASPKLVTTVIHAMRT